MDKQTTIATLGVAPPKVWSPTGLISSARSHLNNLVTSWSLENVSSETSSQAGGSGDIGLAVLRVSDSKSMLKRSTQSLASARQGRFVPRDTSKLTSVGHNSSASLSAGDLLAQMEKMPALKRMPKTKQRGSLDSIDFEVDDEEDEDDDEFGEELHFGHSLTSSSSYLSSLGSDTSYRLSPLNFDDPRQAIASRLGYACIENIELYHELHRALCSQADDQARRRACSKHVARFGAGYEDDCHFPLVLPVFLNEELKRNSSFVTWEYIHLVADAELAHWQKSALDNLLSRFKSVPALGRPVDHVSPDPNLFLRQLVQQLRASNGKFARVARREKNRALKRWSSYEDLHRDEGVRSELPGSVLSEQRGSTTGEALAMTVPGGSPSRAPRPVEPHQLTGELLAYISRPGLFAHKITKFQFETFRTGLNLQLLSQLVLLKDIVGLSDADRATSFAHNLQTLDNLLVYDDVIVSVVRTHILRGTTPAQQAMAIRSVIEIAILLCQIGNYYGLAKVIGALQGPKVYLLTDAWRHLSLHMPYHFRDYQCLARLARQLSHSILGANRPHLPTLPGLLNRIKLCCSASWDLFEAKRRFCEHPSLADWLHTEVFGHAKHKTDHKQESDYPAGSLKIRFDPIRESFLSSCDRVRLMSWAHFPTNWAQRYMPAMPDQHTRSLLDRFETFFGPELELYRRYQLPKISVAQYNHDQWL